jgi:hypothetical protein
MAKRVVRDSTHIATRHAVAIGAAMCLFCLTAQAGEIDGHTFEAPPPQYDYEPSRPYKIRVDSQLVDIFCGRPGGKEILGCLLDDGKAPIIFIREGLSPELEREVRRHELGHINGWEH